MELERRRGQTLLNDVMQLHRHTGKLYGRFLHRLSEALETNAHNGHEDLVNAGIGRESDADASIERYEAAVDGVPPRSGWLHRRAELQVLDNNLFQVPAPLVDEGSVDEEAQERKRLLGSIPERFMFNCLSEGDGW